MTQAHAVVCHAPSVVPSSVPHASKRPILALTRVLLPVCAWHSHPKPTPPTQWPPPHHPGTYPLPSPWFNPQLLESLQRIEHVGSDGGRDDLTRHTTVVGVTRHADEKCEDLRRSYSHSCTGDGGSGLYDGDNVYPSHKALAYGMVKLRYMVNALTTNLDIVYGELTLTCVGGGQCGCAWWRPMPVIGQVVWTARGVGGSVPPQPRQSVL